MTGANNAPRGIAGLIVGTVFLLSCSGPGLEPGRPPLSISWVSAADSILNRRKASA